MITFDVIVPTSNNIDELRQCLSSLECQTFKDFYVFICVDGSTDDTLNYLKETTLNFKFNILTHPNFQNKGRNPTRNLVIPHLNSHFIIMIDSDIHPHCDLLQRHYNLLSKQNCISVGEVIYTNTKQNIWADYIQTRGKNKYNDLAEIPAYYLISQNLAMRTEDFINIGGQDEKMVTYGGGDTEFGYRISRQLNIPVIFNQKALGYSVMPKTLDYALKQLAEFGKINLPYIHDKYPEFKSLFHFDLIESSSIKSKIVKLLLKKWIYRIIKHMTKSSAPIIRRKLIHYLVFYSIYNGYYFYINK